MSFAHGQCIEQYGAGEAYMPILEALGRLCREPGGERLIALLHHHAPTWLVQMPSLLDTAELETLLRKVQDATRERMLREMGSAVDAITAERPLVLWLEDLHWSDLSTLELLALLARRREPARLLVLSTYRPVDVIVREHPLKEVKQELQLHGQCEELAVRLLTEGHIAEYLTVRMQVSSPARAGEGQNLPRTRCEGEGLSSSVLPSLARTIHERTEGNPLFMVNLVDDLVAHGKVEGPAVELTTPATIREMIEQQLERLSVEDQRLLDAASVAGMEFSATAIAAGLTAPIEEVEPRCATLARRGQFLQALGTAEWPDGTVATRYGFLHALYQEVTYERVLAGRQACLHQRIGERIEAAYGKQVGEVAAELAVHFERGRNYRRAVQYLGKAGENTLRRSANQEAVAHLTKGLELLRALPDTPERLQQELMLQISLGVALMAIKGYAAPEAKKAYDRARELCQQMGDTPQLVPVLKGLSMFYYVRAELLVARELEKQLLRLTQGQEEQALLLEAHLELGGTLFSLGEFTAALDHLEEGSRLYDPPKHYLHTIKYGQDPGVSCLCRTSQILWLLDYQDQAMAKNREAVALAERLAHPHSLAYALNSSGLVHQFCRDMQKVREQAEAAIQLATNYEFPIWKTMGEILRGWGEKDQGQVQSGIRLIQQGISSWRAIGAEIALPYFLYLLAEAYAKVGTPQKGEEVVDDALALTVRTEDRWWESELHRLRGELTLQQLKVKNEKLKMKEAKGKSQKQKEARGWRLETGPASNQAPSLKPLVSGEVEREAEECFLKAIEIAQHQQAKSLELRATVSLARLWQQQGRQHEARNMLFEIYNWFTEGFDTADLQEAKALLEELSHRAIEPLSY